MEQLTRGISKKKGFWHTMLHSKMDPHEGMLAAKIEDENKMRGAQRMAFNTPVDGGSNGSVAHSSRNDQEIGDEQIRSDGVPLQSYGELWEENRVLSKKNRVLSAQNRALSAENDFLKSKFAEQEAKIKALEQFVDSLNEHLPATDNEIDKIIDTLDGIKMHRRMGYFRDDIEVERTASNDIASKGDARYPYAKVKLKRSSMTFTSKGDEQLIFGFSVPSELDGPHPRPVFRSLPIDCRSNQPSERSITGATITPSDVYVDHLPRIPSKEEDIIGAMPTPAD